MNFSPPSQSDVPAIRIHCTDDNSVLFNGGDMFSTDMDSYIQDASVFACSQGFQTEFLPPTSVINTTNTTSDLEDLSELSHLITTNQPYLTSNGYAFPYTPIVQENVSADRGLSPSFGSPLPSPTPSFGSSLSPSSLCDPFSISDTDSLLSLSPVTPDSQSLWPSYGQNQQSNESLVSTPSFLSGDALAFSDFPHVGLGPHRSLKSSPSRNGPVASKAMLEANGRRRRHPAQFQCEECNQTFTALFSLKRHRQSHSGERPFMCSIPGCSQRFYNSSDCKRHERSLKRHKDLQQ